jgi:lipoprotein
MKNTFLIIPFLALGMVSCSDGMGGIPLITVDSIQINGESIGRNILYPIPMNATVRVFTTLEAYDGTLRSFNTEVNYGENEVSGYQKAIEFEKDVVSDDKNMTNPEEGVLRFKDGVVKTNVAVETIAPSTKDTLKLRFYLNTDDKGTKEELVFKIVSKSHREND